jgi:putative membrane protein
MGGADAIPGVSGGTIALILGIYDLFIESLHQVVRAPLTLIRGGDRGKVVRALRFLIPLGIGVAVAYFLATKLLVGKSESPGLMIRPETAPACYAFFFGLVLFSLREPWRRIKTVGLGHYAAALAGCAAAAIFAGLPHASQEPAIWMLFLGGAGAISVMIMPGVSGSLLLVILGQYQTIVNAVHDRNFGVVGVFILGMGCGVLLFVPTLRLLLKRHHDLTMAALTGLMAGSLRALWPWKSHYDIKEAQMVNTGVGDHLMLVIVAALAGIAVVFLLFKLEHRLEGKN